MCPAFYVIISNVRPMFSKGQATKIIKEGKRMKLARYFKSAIAGLTVAAMAVTMLPVNGL